MTLCILKQRDGKWYCINCNGSPLKGNYKRVCKNNRKLQPTTVVGFPQGPGVELKRLLRKIGIVPEANCKCKDHAKQMDDLGVDWCEANIEQVIDWMAEEAKKRGYPFLRKAGRILVKRAIKNARRKAAFLK